MHVELENVAVEPRQVVRYLRAAVVDPRDVVRVVDVEETLHLPDWIAEEGDRSGRRDGHYDERLVRGRGDVAQIEIDGVLEAHKPLLVPPRDLPRRGRRG